MCVCVCVCDSEGMGGCTNVNCTLACLPFCIAFLQIQTYLLVMKTADSVIL